MIKNVAKKILFIIFVLSIASYTYADNNDSAEKARSIIAANKDAMLQVMKDSYEYFKIFVTQKIPFEDISSGWINFNDNNDKLMIGSSGAVYCGATMGNEELNKYGYDLVAYGGIFDNELIDLLKILPDKAYDKIVIFGGVNDLNIRTTNGFNDIDLYYCEVLDELLLEAKKHLKDENSKVVYIKIKELVFGRDNTDSSFVIRYNNMAKEINDNIELFGYASYDIPYETTVDYTAHYIHYNNKVVFEDMFNAIDGM